MSGGKGLSSTLGVAAFPDGIVYRVGNPAPAVYVARLAFSQTFDLGGGKVVNEGGRTSSPTCANRDVLAITVGRFSVVDVVDGNRYSNDATTEFFNWALFASGRSTTRPTRAATPGASWGILAKGWCRPAAGSRSSRTTPTRRAWTGACKSRASHGRVRSALRASRATGGCSLLLFWNTARMGSYEQVLANPALYDNDIVKTRADGRHKYGFALSSSSSSRRRWAPSCA